MHLPYSLHSSKSRLFSFFLFLLFFSFSFFLNLDLAVAESLLPEMVNVRHDSMSRGQRESKPWSLIPLPSLEIDLERV